MPLAQKVATSAIAGAATVVLVWLVSLAGVAVPDTVQGALIVLFSFAAGWKTPSK